MCALSIRRKCVFSPAYNLFNVLLGPSMFEESELQKLDRKAEELQNKQKEELQMLADLGGVESEPSLIKALTTLRSTTQK